jgi:DNA-binding response OmpR family regulator
MVYFSAPQIQPEFTPIVLCETVAIIAVTDSLNGEEQTARAAGCDDYVPKPFSPRQLLAKIRQFLQ